MVIGWRYTLAPRDQLQELVDWANEKGSIIVFDAA
jgi:aspartate/methionine/tyrosine aminotransferase